MQPDPSPSFWAVTSYFNPARYKRRHANFRAFQRNLSIPLLVVEISRDGQFELTKDDADIVVQLRGEDRIWQKERLINIGISELPRSATYVAWIDCDAVFENSNWPAIAQKLFAQKLLDDRGGLVQLFSIAVHLAPEFCIDIPSAEACANAPALFLEPSFASDYRNNVSYDFVIRGNSRGKPSELEDPLARDKPVRTRKPVPGIAWAARRSVMESAPLFDRNVIGGGDVVNILRTDEELDVFVATRGLTEAHKQAIRKRMMKSHLAGLSSCISCVDQAVYHLWHGNMVNRNYAHRQSVLARHNFNPNSDVVLAQNGTLDWRDPESMLAKDVAAYFYARREDG
jgi:hypothetical protein